jgi:N-acetylglucosaminyldiphosphoundecaprenol N-acetyl-beta-D-mannosaminyltransferase
MDEIDRVNMLGVTVDLLTMQALTDLTARAIAEGRRVLIANHNLHSVYLYHRSAEMRAFYQRAEHIHMDGMPLVYWARLMGFPAGRQHRTTYVDWLEPLMSVAVRNGWRVFYLGGRPGVAETAAQKLRAAHPGLQIATHHGYFETSGTPNALVLAEILRFQPHLLMVGMGMPRQETWILKNLDALPACVILPAGACFDYVAGAIPTPDRRLAAVGLEWLARLLAEPDRLWRRYLLEPWALLPLFLADLRRKWQGGSSVSGRLSDG